MKKKLHEARPVAPQTPDERLSAALGDESKIPSGPKACPHCGVTVLAQHTSCPLCAQVLQGAAGDSCTRYPQYRSSVPILNALKKSMLFALICAMAVCITVNLLTLRANPHYWAAIACTGIFWLYITVRNTIMSRTLPGTRVFLQLIAISGVVISIDLCYGFRFWSLDYVVPFLCMGATLAVSIFAIIFRSRPQDYVWFLLAALLVSVCPLVIFLFKLTDVLWPSVAALVFAVLTVVGLLIFSDRRFKTELKKRFHL